MSRHTLLALAMLYLVGSGEAFAVSRAAGMHARAPRQSAVVSMSSAAPDGRRAALGGLATAVGGALVGAASPALAANTSPWGLSEFMKKVDKDEVEKVIFSENGRELLALDSDGDRHAVEILPAESPEILQTLREHKVQFAVAAPAPDNSGIASVVGNLAFPLLFLGGLFLLNRGGGMGGAGGGGPGAGGPGNPMQMMQPKSKIQMEPKTGVTFDDVAGCDASKLELTEVVDFLKNPEKYTKIGAKSPRGVLLEGPPGTGKTLLARAVAGEAGVPFISTSGSEFVEMFVGVGASRIRNLFQEAKKNAPAIIFIDEIDAIGRQRSGGGGMATNDEREQTLNQILTEMDGFSGNSGVIVIAATNRGDILDSALLRPGRFDRRVPVDNPDKAGRAEILKVHIRGKPLAPDVDVDTIAGRTIGFSGAQLQNLMNEAAIVAARRDKDVITFDEIDFALDRLTVGMQKTTGTSNKDRQKLVAYHEAGHAVMAALTPDYDTVAKVTIIPRTNGAGGFTLFTPSDDRLDSGMYSMKYLKAQLSVALGGRVAEELVFGTENVTTGASNDLQQVLRIARAMVTQFGYSKRTLAPTAWETGNENGMSGKSSSSATSNSIDEEVKKLTQDAYDVCYQTLKANMPLMDALVERLLESETVDAGELQKLVFDFSEPIDAAEAPVAA